MFSLIQSHGFSKVNFCYYCVFEKKDEVCPTDIVSLLHGIENRSDKSVCIIKLLLWKHISVSLVIEQPKLVSALVHEDEYLAWSGILFENVLDVVLETIPFVVSGQAVQADSL